MSALTEFLFPAPAKRSAKSILFWWEKRRPVYNLVVGGAGLVSIGLASLIAWLPPGGFTLTSFPWQGALAFGVLANVFYFLGPITETLIEKIWGREVLPTGPVLFRMGLTVSVGMAFLPTMLMVVVWVLRVLGVVPT